MDETIEEKWVAAMPSGSNKDRVVPSDELSIPPICMDYPAFSGPSAAFFTEGIPVGVPASQLPAQQPTRAAVLSSLAIDGLPLFTNQVGPALDGGDSAGFCAELSELEGHSQHKRKGATKARDKVSATSKPSVKSKGKTNRKKPHKTAGGTERNGKGQSSVKSHAEEQRVKRLLRNRLSAQQARERKKHYVSGLEKKAEEYANLIAELQERNEKLVKENDDLHLKVLSLSSR